MKKCQICFFGLEKAKTGNPGWPGTGVPRGGGEILADRNLTTRGADKIEGPGRFAKIASVARAKYLPKSQSRTHPNLLQIAQNEAPGPHLVTHFLAYEEELCIVLLSVEHYHKF